MKIGLLEVSKYKAFLAISIVLFGNLAKLGIPILTSFGIVYLFTNLSFISLAVFGTIYYLSMVVLDLLASTFVVRTFRFETKKKLLAKQLKLILEKKKYEYFTKEHLGKIRTELFEVVNQYVDLMYKRFSNVLAVLNTALIFSLLFSMNRKIAVTCSSILLILFFINKFFSYLCGNKWKSLIRNIEEESSIFYAALDLKNLILRLSKTKDIFSKLEQRILYIVKCFAQIDVLSTASVMMIRLISNLVPIALLVLPQIETRPEHNSLFGTGIIGFLILLLISNSPQLINLTYINEQLTMFRKRLLDFQNSAIDEYNEEQKPLHRDNNIQTLSLRNYDLFSGGQHLLHINKLDLEAPNQYVLIGKTGVGKSLFAKSIVGLYHAYKGDIFINNIDHNHWKTNGLVHSIGYIRQSPPVLNQPLLEVLGFNSEFTAKNIFEAFDFLELEAIHDMIRRDYKWNPKQAGYHLSMGERVRLAVLRVLALGAKALILDEITAHIDRNTENHLLKVLSELNILSLYISHKEETIKRFENVLTLKDSILLRKDLVSGNESCI